MSEKRHGKAHHSQKLISYDLYNRWRVEYPEFKETSFQQFKNYFNLLIKEYKNEVLTNPHGVRLPFYNGDMSLRFIQDVKVNINHGLTKKVGEPVKHLNILTNGKQGKIVWSVDHARKFNRMLPLLAFTPTSSFQDDASKAFRDTPEIFRTTQSTKASVKQAIKRYEQKKNDQLRSNISSEETIS